MLRLFLVLQGVKTGVPKSLLQGHAQVQSAVHIRHAAVEHALNPSARMAISHWYHRASDHCGPGRLRAGERLKQGFIFTEDLRSFICICKTRV